MAVKPDPHFVEDGLHLGIPVRISLENIVALVRIAPVPTKYNSSDATSQKSE